MSDSAKHERVIEESVHRYLIHSTLDEDICERSTRENDCEGEHTDLSPLKLGHTLAMLPTKHA